jgi:hypothetical protein
VTVHIECPSCDLAGGPFAAGEAAALAARHDELHHGGARTATVGQPGSPPGPAGPGGPWWVLILNPVDWFAAWYAYPTPRAAVRAADRAYDRGTEVLYCGPEPAADPKTQCVTCGRSTCSGCARARRAATFSTSSGGLVTGSEPVWWPRAAWAGGTR